MVRIPTYQTCKVFLLSNGSSHVLFEPMRYLSIAFHTSPNHFGFEYGIVADDKASARWGQTTGYVDTKLDKDGRPELVVRDKRWRSITTDQ
jgi:hypothetical protein